MILKLKEFVNVVGERQTARVKGTSRSKSRVEGFVE